MATKITIMEAGPGGYVTAIRAAQLGAEGTVIKQEKMSWGIIVCGGKSWPVKPYLLEGESEG